MNEAFDSVLLRVLLGPIVAALQLFALYVVVHGHYSPGGGFQAGVLLACSAILPRLVHGAGAHQRGFLTLSQTQALALSAMGVMVFTMIGMLSLVFQSPMLDYDALPLPQAVGSAERHSLGILGIEVGVMFAVAGAAIAIFHTLHEDDVRPIDESEGSP